MDGKGMSLRSNQKMNCLDATKLQNIFNYKVVSIRKILWVHHDNKVDQIASSW